MGRALEIRRTLISLRRYQGLTLICQRGCQKATAPVGGVTGAVGGLDVPRWGLGTQPSKLKNQVRDSCPEAQCPEVQCPDFNSGVA